MKLLAICLVFIIILLWANRTNTVPVQAGNRSYNVIQTYKDKEEAAKIFGELHRRMMVLMAHLKKKYVGVIDYCAGGTCSGFDIDDPSRTATEKVVLSIIRNYNPDVFYENDPAVSNETAYTINKGRAMYFCIRDKENQYSFCDFDMLLFAMLHEVSHIGNHDGWGHQEQFWRIFKFILQEAVEAGVYKPVDYSRFPKNYCGLDVAYNPLFDGGLKSIV
jgi:hypothetical protein